MDRLTVRSFAGRVEVSERQVYRWMEAGSVKPRRTPGGRPFFTEEDVAAYESGTPICHGEGC